MTKGEHTAHRQRLKERYLREGMDSLEEHVVLELLLFFAIPRCDTNKTAHKLIDRFGSLHAVFDAPMEELIAVDGIGESSALLIKAVPDFYRRYAKSKMQNGSFVNSLEDIGKYLMPFFAGVNVEVMYLLLLDGHRRIIACEKMTAGSVNMAALSVREIVAAALKYNAVAAVVAHNHPNAVLIPSQTDIVTTEKIYRALKAVDVTLLDHMIMSDTDFVSLHQSGMMSQLQR
ncbi:MAG: DNA repair protein RadC [Ruminococcaceae bacterium]|nr:DNA repair protein RadC [Oscillospiraceae bacterium]